MASTATDSMILPEGSPAASGTEPIAACTVAFGRYAITQNNLSLALKGVLIRHISTPAVLNKSAVIIITTAAIPAPSIYLISTAAPTSTKSITSAASHNFPNFSDNLFDTNAVLLSLSTQAMLTTARSPEIATFPSSQLSIDTRRNENPSTIITFILFLTQCLCA